MFNLNNINRKVVYDIKNKLSASILDTYEEYVVKVIAEFILSISCRDSIDEMVNKKYSKENVAIFKKYIHKL